MAKIFLLDEITANKIAAGEVIERPAAVVKELLENAMDAGATRIDVQITEGGLESISVVDNGEGISPEDVPLALQRHATSKIKDDRDLAAVMTLGFRGEALPSIASVSRFTLLTRQAHTPAGVEMRVSGGKNEKLTEAGCPVGTQVRVEDLFFNTPARRKFLKKESSETAKITEVVQRLALARPDISFSYTSGGKKQFYTPGNGQLGDVLSQVLGRQNMRQMISLNREGGTISLSGYIARPVLCRANRNLQYFYINGRVVRSPLISDAIQTAYHTLLPRNRFPAAVIFVSLPPADVDVNVHPAKREVRFANEREIYTEIIAGIKDALHTAHLVPGMGGYAFSQAREPVAAHTLFDSPPQRTGTFPPDAVSYYPPFRPKKEESELFTVRSSAGMPYTGKPGMETMTSETNASALLSNGNLSAESMPVIEKQIIHTFPKLYPLGQYLATYILAQSERGELYIVDQHAAHERILYEEIKRDLSEGSLPVQEMLPVTLDLDPGTASVLADSLEILGQLGLTFEPFGHNSFILRTIPMFFRGSLNQDEILALIASDKDELNTLTLFDKTILLMSCKAAIRANQHLQKPEMERLLNLLAETRQPHSCPHGRPTALVFSESSLAGAFRRK